MSLIVETALSSLFGALGARLEKKLDEIKPKEIQTVTVKEDPDTYSITELDRATTTSKKWNNKDNPNLQFENVLEKISTVKEISITPDAIFKTKGMVIITIDDSEVFKSKSFSAFTNITDSTIQINKTIQQNSKVKVFIISSDGTEIALTVQVTLGG